MGQTLKYKQFFETTIIAKVTVLQFFTFKVHCCCTCNLRFVKTNPNQLIRSLFRDSRDECLIITNAAYISAKVQSTMHVKVATS